MQRVIERTKVWVDLVAQRAGEEAEVLTRLHRRTGQDDPVDLLVLQRLDGLRDGEIGLSRASRPNAEHHGVLVDGVDVPLLVERLRADRLAAGGQDVVGQHVGRPGFLPSGKHRADAFHGVRGQALPGPQHGDQLGDHVDREVNRCR